MLRICSVIVLILALSTPVLALTVRGQAHAVDGDTLDLAGHRIRLFGIDAPEHRQTCDRGGLVWDCGVWAREALAAALSQAAISCVVQHQDRYGRAVAICHVGDSDIGQSLVQSGAATAYRRYSLRYAGDEAMAAQAGKGIWGATMQAPEAYRHGAEPAPIVGDCGIKGNISAKGRIYHRPGQRDYAATKIVPAKGEAYFCSPAAAEAAGFRPARR